MPEGPNDLLRAALNYAARGWPVFPCRHDKTPHTPNGVLDATTDPDKLRGWWDKWPGANVAVDVGGAGMMVLDLDPGHSIEELEKNVGPLPDTALASRTPRGGRHLFFALQDGELVSPSSSKLAPHVDVRSFHSYVLLPPSQTADGPYAWEADEEPARRTDEMVRVANLAREKSPHRDDWAIEPDLEENVSLGRAWLRGERAIGNSWCKLAVEGAGGDATTYATAAMMKSCGLSEGTALELLWEEWNDRCDPPWDYEELAIKVGNGYAYNTSPPGNVTPAYHVAVISGLFQPIKTESFGDEGRQVTSGRFRFVDGPGLKGVHPPEWLIEGAIPRDSYVLLSGRTGSYKTFLALDMALTVATGGHALAAGDWAGFWGGTPTPGPVLFAVGEGRAGLRLRAEAWVRHHLGLGVVTPEFVLADPVPHVKEGTLDKFVEGALKLHPGGYRLVVLDTVSRATQGENESATEVGTSFTAMADAMRRELGDLTSVLALHHTGHVDDTRARGSSAFLGDPDTLLMSRLHRTGLARLAMTKQKDWPEWDDPRWAELRVVPVEGDQTSLVALAADAPRDNSEMEGKVGLREMDRFALAALRRNPEAEYNDKQLAEVIHSEGRLDDDGQKLSCGKTIKTIRSNWLPDLREVNSGAAVQGMYDTKKGVWRYSQVADRGFTPED